MSPTLEPGDRLLVDRAAYRQVAPAHGEIVVVRDPEGTGEYRVKRVAEPPHRIPDGTLWLLGDRPEASRDSRQIGPVPLRLLVGRAWYRYAPRGREGPVDRRRAGGNRTEP